MRIVLLCLGLLLSPLAISAPLSADTPPPAAATPPAVAADVPSDEPAADLPFNLTTDDVLSMMAQVPATEFGSKPYPRWAKQGQANRIAKAIADHASSREEAADMVLYDLFESGNRTDVVGDGGHSYGPWQLSDKRADPKVAANPDAAAPIWLSIRDRSRKDCEKLPEEERLAELGSGTCQRGRALARRRAKLRVKILASD